MWAQHERQKEELQAERIRLARQAELAEEEKEDAERRVNERRRKLMDEEENCEFTLNYTEDWHVDATL